MALSFHRFDPSPCGFPAPRAPLLPRFSLAGAALGAPARPGTVFFRRESRFYRRGRYALLEAFRLAGVGPQGALLAPAYHCRTMLDPAQRLAGEVRLYPLNADLTPDFTALAALCAAPGAPVRALLLTHYFGFAQPAAVVARWCAERGIALIEDCSHAFFGEAKDVSGQALVALGSFGEFGTFGTFGDYAVASPWKFFPCADGGVLVANRGAVLPAEPARGGAAAELKAEAKAVLGSLRGVGRLRGGADETPEQLHRRLAQLAATPAAPAVEGVAEDGGLSPHYRPEDEGLAGLRSSRLLMRATDAPRLIARRRRHYAAWAQGVAGLAAARPLHPALPDSCVPYMFPLLVEHPEFHFALLKRLGVPIWRWDEMARSACPVAAAYRLRLLQLPCHQDLSAGEMAWMIAAVRAVLELPVPGGAP
ncbi:MAG: hypothetical protein BGO63_02635 [Candidatus Accumulibacter sp. 66-26]|nr:MAG: hypothetical protein BGO63_02635 [Candidatus Accumulibacter sp. 66-26]